MNNKTIHNNMDILHKVNLHIFEQFQAYIEREYTNSKIWNETQASLEEHTATLLSIRAAWEAYKQGYFAGSSKAPEGHNEPCYYCKKLTNSFAGNPSEWPVALCHPDDPGRVKWHHIGCVSERLHK